MTSKERSAGFHFLFAGKPEIKSQTEMKKLFSIPEKESEHYFSVKPDLLQFLMQIFVVSFSTVGFMFIFSREKSIPKRLMGGILIFLGIIFLFLYSLYFFR